MVIASMFVYFGVFLVFFANSYLMCAYHFRALLLVIFSLNLRAYQKSNENVRYSKL